MPTSRPVRLAPRSLALGAATLAMLAGCSQRPDPAPGTAATDSALNNDLTLAGQQQGATQVVSPQELTGAPAARAAEPARTPERTRVVEHVIYRDAPTPARAPVAYAVPAPAAAPPPPAPVYTPYPSAPYPPATYPAPRRDGTYNGGGYGNGGYGNGGYGNGGYRTGNGTYGAAPAPVYRQPQGHAQRDGAIGAVAGAMVGVAAAHRKDRLRGGLIGAVAGGALGAVFGHSVDRTP